MKNLAKTVSRCVHSELCVRPFLSSFLKRFKFFRKTEKEMKNKKKMPK